jgi:phosphoglycolate phosphatase
MAESKCEKIAIAQQYFKIPATRTYMIGDAISDIRQGKLAGVQTIAVTWGFQRRDLLLAEQPDYVVDSPAELKQFAFAAKLLDG